MLTEQQIIKDCQQGKKSSQYELVRRYSGMLMTVCRRYVTDEAAAKDVLQESLILIFKNIGKYKPIGSFEAWMRKITMRSALRWIKRQAFFSTSNLEIVYSEELVIAPEVYQTLAVEELIQLIQNLPTGFRTVFNLNIIEGYSHKEIGKMLNITESSSRSQLVRARRLLQKKLVNSKHFKHYKSL